MKMKFKAPALWTPQKTFVIALLGPVLLLLALGIYIINPLKLITDYQMSFRRGSMLYNIWQKPPMEVLISVYMLNYTNVDRFDRGQDAKLKVQQVGPYVYQEVLENFNVTFNVNDTVTFVPKRTVKFRRDLSVSDPKIDQIIAPNIPYMGVTSAVSEMSIITALAMRTLTHTVGSKAMLKMSVYDYLWGYKDPLVHLASKVVPFFINFERFGLLERMFVESYDVVNMHIPSKQREQLPNATARGRDYSINTWNYKKTIHFWTNKNKNMTDCNRVYDTYDATIFPRHIRRGENFRIYRKAFCRTLPLVFSHPTTYNGIDVYKFKLHERAFESNIVHKNTSCFCPNGKCLKRGLGNIKPCYFNMPLAISLPHFYNSDASLLNLYEGLQPSEEKHDTIIYIEPNLGIPMHVKGRFQMNLVLNSLRTNGDLSRFRNSVVPVFWLEIGLEDFPTSLKLMLTFLFRVAPVVQYGAIIFLIAGGLFIIALVFAYQKTGATYSPMKAANILPLIQKTNRSDEARASLIPPSTKSFELHSLTELELEPPMVFITEDLSDS